ncbi:hypothetical protein PHLCEN_2v2688 [Hermanssonia centrifuga]|uniref:Uncharacterized protein n=1 Tax=Hermanssonia centrifuga TaxID=98765 RepID=A0A1U7KE25_9APHY|nr:hypothetical protein PHLCEN_2v2688 [Hermanssonia centrifuga]
MVRFKKEASTIDWKYLLDDAHWAVHQALLAKQDNASPKRSAEDVLQQPRKKRPRQ